MYDSMAIIDNVNVQQVANTMQKISQFQALVQGNLKRDHDYGIIPGTPKPTLLKPGAEKILMLMGLTSEYDIIEKVQDYDTGFFAFTVKCVLSRGETKITEGVGHANTREGRYAHRWVTERKLPEGIDKSTLPKREKDGQYGKYFEYQIGNDDPYTLANTVLKMAKKRSQVDAVLTVASLSEIFTQDLEDMDLGAGIGKGKTEEKGKGKSNRGQGQQAKQEPPTDKDKNQTQQTNPDMITEPQAKKIWAMSKEKGIDGDGLKQIAKEKWGVESSKDLTKRQASEFIEYLQGIE